MAVTYEGLNARINGCERNVLGKNRGKTYPGNCADLQAEAMWRMEQAGLSIVGHVHDEVILELPAGSITEDEVCAIMNQNPEWATVFPCHLQVITEPTTFKD
jgi:DNA polymerase